MRLINDQPAVVGADWLEGAVESTGQEELEERRDAHFRLREGRCGAGLEGLVPRRRAPAPGAGTAEGGRR
jgi:hypothetical protein